MNEIDKALSESRLIISEMSDLYKEISEFVQTISQIAVQTNLLSLNASIEASRAGEHGKGFAVVADEVRKLAERSSNATKEISNLINGIQTTVTESVKAMNEGYQEVEKGVLSANNAGRALSQIIEAAQNVQKTATATGESAAKMNHYSSELVAAVDLHVGALGEPARRDRIGDLTVDNEG